MSDQKKLPEEGEVIVMSKRDHFAFCAMQAMVLPIDNPERHAEKAARAAFAYADAMLAESDRWAMMGKH